MLKLIIIFSISKFTSGMNLEMKILNTFVKYWHQKNQFKYQNGLHNNLRILGFDFILIKKRELFLLDFFILYVGWKHNQRSHLNGWTLLKIVFLYFEKITRGTQFFWNKLHYLQSLNVQNLIQIKNVFACLNNKFFYSGQFLFFSTSFFWVKCAPFIFKIGEHFNIDDTVQTC